MVRPHTFNFVLLQCRLFGCLKKDLFVLIMTQAGTLLLLLGAAISLSFLACGLCLSIRSSPLDLDLPLSGDYLSQYLPQRVVVDLLGYPARLDQHYELVLDGFHDVWTRPAQIAKQFPGLRAQQL